MAWEHVRELHSLTNVGDAIPFERCPVCDGALWDATADVDPGRDDGDRIAACLDCDQIYVEVEDQTDDAEVAP